ncbi:hypothetical protein LINPERHAP2_LOCUS32344 [Linum perenne]
MALSQPSSQQIMAVIVLLFDSPFSIVFALLLFLFFLCFNLVHLISDLLCSPPSLGASASRSKKRSRIGSVLHENWTVDNSMEFGIQMWMRNRRDDNPSTIGFGPNFLPHYFYTISVYI